MNETLTIAVRFALYADLLVLTGWAAFGLHRPRRSRRGIEAVKSSRRWFAAGAGAGIIFSLLGLFATAASMANLPVKALDKESVDAVLMGTAFGTALIVRCAMLTLAVVAALLLQRSAAFGWILAAASAIAAASLAWNGHGVADDGTAGWAHLFADVVHLLAAGFWVGALLALIVLLFRPFRLMDAEHLTFSNEALAGFSGLGTIAVAAILVSGLVNSWFLVGPGNIPSLWTTRYGWLLLAKIGLFGAMLGLAAANRFRLTPGLSAAIGRGKHREAVSALRRSLALEAGSATVILAIVAWLGTLESPASAVAM